MQMLPHVGRASREFGSHVGSASRPAPNHVQMLPAGPAVSRTRMCPIRLDDARPQHARHAHLLQLRHVAHHSAGSLSVAAADERQARTRNRGLQEFAAGGDDGSDRSRHSAEQQQENPSLHRVVKPHPLQLGLSQHGRKRPHALKVCARCWRMIPAPDVRYPHNHWPAARRISAPQALPTDVDNQRAAKSSYARCRPAPPVRRCPV